jgi:hypothetical protein
LIEANALKPEPAGPAGGFDPLVDQARLHRLPGGREEAEDAQAASDDPLSDDAGRISAEMGPQRRLSDGRAQLCRAAPDLAKKIGLGTKRRKDRGAAK